MAASSDKKLLCHCETGNLPGERTDSDWDRFNCAATNAGHASGRSAANDLGLWQLPVEEAIALMAQEQVADEEVDSIPPR